VICAVKCSVMCYLKVCFQIHVICIKKLLVCSVNWRDILNYIVINVHSSVVSAIIHLLIRVTKSHLFINTGCVHIYGICVLKISVCCRCVINSVKTGCCSTNSIVRNVLHVKFLLSLCYFNGNWIFSTVFLKILKNKILL